MDVSVERLRATVERLAAFNTRNTLSPECKKAAEYMAEEFAKIPGVTAEVMEYTLPAGRRIPTERPGYQTVAVLKGECDRRVLVGGHLDSLNLSVPAETGRAPGANDDASGVSATLEIARLLAARKRVLTCVFVAFTGEEQGLLGSRAIATKAKADGWPVEAVLSMDTVGSSANLHGQSDPKTLRLFSDDEPGETPGANSRELARWIEWATRGKVRDFGAKLVFRRDRFGRGGDHTPFHQAGFSAVRFIETHEEYTRQHTGDDLPEHMDFPYLGRVTELVGLAMETLATAGEAPLRARISMDQGHDTKVTWEGSGPMRLYWRDSRSAHWEDSRAVSGGEAVVEKVNKDDNCFALGAENGVPIALN